MTVSLVFLHACQELNSSSITGPYISDTPTLLPSWQSLALQIAWSPVRSKDTLSANVGISIAGSPAHQNKVLFT